MPNPLHEALEQARKRLEQRRRDRGERDKVLAQAATGIAEIDAALAASSTPAPTEPRRFEYQAVHWDGRSHPVTEDLARPELIEPGWKIQRAEVFVGPWRDVPAGGGEG